MLSKISLANLMKRKELLIWAIFIAVGLLAALKAGSSSHSEEAQPEPSDSLETFIPKGHLLIPIEVADSERLEGVLGQNGVVDLYQVSDTPGKRAKLVGKRLRLLRAPMNPQAFAVLLRDSEVDQFLSTQGPYIASIRPLQESTHEVTRTRAQLQIDYHRETP